MDKLISYPPQAKLDLNSIKIMKTFSKTDLKPAYHQIPIQEDFKEVKVINTLIGLLRWKKMYGIQTASVILQRSIEQFYW